MEGGDEEEGGEEGEEQEDSEIIWKEVKRKPIRSKAEQISPIFATADLYENKNMRKKKKNKFTGFYFLR